MVNQDKRMGGSSWPSALPVKEGVGATSVSLAICIGGEPVQSNDGAYLWNGIWRAD